MLILIRHGQSLYNEANLLTGHVNTKLSKTGIDEVNAVGDELKSKSIRFDYAFTSPLSRCEETTDIILEKTIAGEAINLKPVGKRIIDASTGGTTVIPNNPEDTNMSVLYGQDYRETGFHLDLIDKVDAHVKDIAKNLAVKNIIKLDAMAKDQASLNGYSDKEFYIPKNIYLDQLNIFDPRLIYNNFSLNTYIVNDKVFIKEQKLNEINLKKRRLLLELQELKNG